ncbi:hypothetical protein I4U23_016447 [Adineta vaga]|nr:hypothetical protein I4U23_016447 [Adineta vaga]
METKIEMKEPTAPVSTCNTSEVKMKKSPPLRGGGACRDHCKTFCFIGVFITIGVIVATVGVIVHSNNESNFHARNAWIAGAVIVILGILCCLLAICQAFQDSCDYCCDCHLGFS